MARRKPTCFVIMPFGEKLVGSWLIDFEPIWHELIKPAGELAGFEITRADSSLDHGIITSGMIENIYKADTAVADVTYHNPNVFYELGIRHALCRHGTVLIKRKPGEAGGRKAIRKPGLFNRKQVEAPEIPFDVKDVAHQFYCFSDQSLDQEIRALAECIVTRHKSRQSDSPVFAHIPRLRVSTGSNPSPGRYDRTYDVLDGPGRPSGYKIGYRSGDIANLTRESGLTVDYWVNSENTMMQMARMFERSFSSTIRHLGAKNPDPNSPTYDDTIQNALNAALGNRKIVDEGEVLVTTSGRLRRTHAVKAVLHAATVTGQPRMGFEPISDTRTLSCIATIIDTARALIRTGDEDVTGRSLIMPLFGCGQGRRDPASLAGQMVSAVIEQLRHPPADLATRDLRQILFCAFSNEEVKLMRRICEALVEDGILSHA